METNNNGLTAKQKQAVVVSILCVLALVVTTCVTMVQVSKAIKANETAQSGSTSTSQPTSSSSSASGSASEDAGYTGEDYIIDPNTNSAVLTQTEDAGEDYLSQTLFIGDSNTMRFYQNGLLKIQQFCAKEGLGIQTAVTDKFVTFKNDSDLYTIPQAVAMMKPQRVILTIGTNNADGSMGADAFVASYQSLIEAILKSYSYTDIIINAIPPVTEGQTAYPNVTQENIDQFNMALAQLALDKGYKFLNSAEALKDETGYGDEAYYVSNDIHLKAAGLNAMLDYTATHAYIADDRRPDTKNIAVRASSASSSSSSTGSSSTTTVNYSAKYFVDATGGGTLSSGGNTGSNNLSYTVDSKSDSITVTAVPNTGYTFLKWSDGVTTATRTDKNFNKNVNVTAVFGVMSLKVWLQTPKEQVVVGNSIEFRASISGGSALLSDIVWYVNGKVNVASTGESSWVLVKAGEDYEVYATITHNGTTATSEKITIDQADLVAVPNIMGMSEQNAKTALTDKKLAAGEITYQETSDTAQQGVVTFQKTAADTKVAEGSKIDFTIGVAPKTTPTPAPTQAPTAKPTATPTAKPTATPTAKPTATPTAKPTATPTAKPTLAPTATPEPTASPAPTAAPTAVVMATPEVTPTPEANSSSSQETTPTETPVADASSETTTA